MQNALTPYANTDLAGFSGSGTYPGGITGGHPPAYDSGGAMSFRDLLRIAGRHKTMIISIVAIATLGVLIWQLTLPTMYRATAHVQVELINEVGANQADEDSRNAQRVANAASLLSSRSAAERVIQDLGLLSDPEFLSELGNPGATGTELEQLAINKLLSMVEIGFEANSDLIEISVTSRYPELAAKIANQVSPSVREVRNAKGNERRTNLLADLEAEQEQRGLEAKEAAQRVADFRQGHRMLVGAGGSEDLQQLNRIATQAAAASAQRAGSSAQSSGVVAANSIRSSALASSAALQQLERQHAELISEQSRLGTSFGPNHPDVKRVSSQLATVEQNMMIERQRAQAATADVMAADAERSNQMARSEAARDAAQAARLQGIAASVESKAYQNTANSVELEELVREANLADDSYKAIAARVEQVRAQMQMEGVSSSIVSPAVPDYDAISPTPLKMTVLAFLGSTIIAFLIALMREFMDDRLRTSAQVRRNFGLPTFGMLPLLSAGHDATEPEESPVIKNPQSLFAEVSRAAYCDIRAMHEGSDAQVILVSSPLPGDGKSTVSLALAAAGVAMGDRTLILDLDLRKPGYLQKLQNNMPSPDLIDIISGRARLDSLLPEPSGASSDREGDASPSTRDITLLSAHRPVEEPAALLSSPKLTALLHELRERFDLIVINAPATLAVRDARGMCHFADQSVMVARWGRTTIEQMNAALELLSYQVSGIIFDHVDYAQHARHRYGDSVQFYVDSSDYYSDDIRHPAGLGGHLRSLGRRLRDMFGRRPEAEAA